MLITVGILGVVFGLLLGWTIANGAANKKIAALQVENARLTSLEEIKNTVLGDFTNLANQALIENQKKLDEQNKTALEDKLKPLTEAISRYQKQVDDFNKENIKDAAALKTEVVNLARNSQLINEETQKLTKALTKSQNIKGSYGESTLEVILQTSGMEEGVHYLKHLPSYSVNAQGEEKRIYPDYVVNLPQNKHIIIDSKMNLENFIRFQNEEEKEAKERYLKEFRADIKNTVKMLSEKNYQEAKDLSSPDFVLMYVPLESSLSLIYQDEDILNFASSKNVVLVGTASLITTIRLVKNIFAQEKRRDGHLEIAKCGALLYSKFVDFCANLVTLQKKLQDVDREFTTTINRFKRGEDSLFRTSKRLEELGIESNNSKEIPMQFLEEDSEEATDEVSEEKIHALPQI